MLPADLTLAFGCPVGWNQQARRPRLVIGSWKDATEDGGVAAPERIEQARVEARMFPGPAA